MPTVTLPANSRLGASRLARVRRPVTWPSVLWADLMSISSSVLAVRAWAPLSAWIWAEIPLKSNAPEVRPPLVQVASATSRLPWVVVTALAVRLTVPVSFRVSGSVSSAVGISAITLATSRSSAARFHWPWPLRSSPFRSRVQPATLRAPRGTANIPSLPFISASPSIRIGRAVRFGIQSSQSSSAANASASSVPRARTRSAIRVWDHGGFPYPLKVILVFKTVTPSSWTAAFEVSLESSLKMP